MLDGVFGFVLYDEKTQEVYVARDFGIRPLYTCFHTNKWVKNYYICITIKAIDYIQKI